MANFTDYMEEVIIKWLRNDTPVAAPSQLAVALFINSSGIENRLEQGILTDEVSTVGTAYSRKALVLGMPSNGNTSNTSEIAWPAATNNWGTVSHFGILDDAANLLMWGALTSPKTVNTNDVFKFNVGGISVDIQ